MRLSNLLLCAAAGVASFAVDAQEQPAQGQQVLEEVFVTGSLIRRSSFGGPSAVQQVTAEEMQVEGASTIVDVVRNLSINTGSHLARFAPEFGGSSGSTSQFNLRGLGINATLTLVDGRRLAPSPSSGMGGAQFVNINQIPSSMIERIDILKTGASATYGSEAVAGVVNIITKKNFEGFEFSMDHRDSSTVPWSESSISAIAGTSTDRGRATVGFEMQERNLLKTIDLPSNISDTLVFRTSFGQPGAFNPVGTNVYYSDPLCGQPGQPGLSQSIPPGTFPTGRCSASLKEFFTALPDDQRLTAWGNAEYDVTDSIVAYAQIGYSKQDTWGTGPTSTVPNQFHPTIPGNHPDWPDELIAQMTNNGANPMPNAILWGRHVLNDADAFTQLDGKSMAIGGISELKYRNLLSVFGFNGNFDTDSGRRWDWDVSWTGSYNDGISNGRATSKTRWQAAINNCLDPSDPVWQPAAGCWNPFSNAYTGDPNYHQNTQAVMDYISPYDTTYTETKLESVNATMTGGLMDLPGGGELSIAFGVQTRKEVYNNDPDSQQNRGDNVNQSFAEEDQFRHRTVNAYFAELAVPFEKVELQLAVRTEDYGSQGGSSTDPKVAFEWDVTDNFRLRGSWSTAFRAPSLNQFGVSTESRTITPPWQPISARALYSVTINTETLDPETSEATTLGFVWDVNDGLNFGIDAWNFDYKDLIAIQDPAGLLASVCNASGCDPSKPGYDQIVFDANGDFRTMTVLGINAAAVQLSGVDFFGSWSPDVRWADSYTMRLDSSYFTKYDIQEFEGGPTIDAVGYANLENIAPSVPQLRWNLMNSFSWGKHSANVAIRYVDSLVDRVVNTTAPNLASRTTIDAQYNYYFDAWGKGGTLSFGAINLLDETITFSDNETGIVGDRDDPRGRTFYLTYRQAF